MRVVIDASIDPRLVEAFPDHEVETLFDIGWQDLKDHVLVKLPEVARGVCNDQPVSAVVKSTQSAQVVREKAVISTRLSGD